MENNRINAPESEKNDGSFALKIISWLFGFIALAIGIVNAFWGKPAGFGVFIMLLSLVYFLPVNTVLKKVTGLKIPRLGVFKILVALFILWAALGVGELFNKIEVMLNYFKA